MEAASEQKRPDALAASILRAAGLSVDDLKSLETVFRELAVSFGNTIAGQTEIAAAAEFVGIRSLEKDAIADVLNHSALVGMVPASKWGSRIVLAADRKFVD
ncbi:MAG: hypothetical protein ACRECY_04815, partial [Phyllobacterium sp.]